MLDLTLRAGDTLYLPRGWLHDALTSDTDSLHLTVGVNVHTWTDAFRAALADCERDVEFRRSVPADGDQAADLLDRLAEQLAPEDVRRRPGSVRRQPAPDPRRPPRGDASARAVDADTRSSADRP